MEVMFKILPPKKTVVEGFADETAEVVETEKSLSPAELQIKASYEEPDIVDPNTGFTSPMRVKEEEKLMSMSEIKGLEATEELSSGVIEYIDSRATDIISEEIESESLSRAKNFSVLTVPTVMAPKKAYPEAPKPYSAPLTPKPRSSAEDIMHIQSSKEIDSEFLLAAALESEE
jgi:hypothetical protein